MATGATAPPHRMTIALNVSALIGRLVTLRLRLR
jgi:hypothetical protein